MKSVEETFLASYNKIQYHGNKKNPNHVKKIENVKRRIFLRSNKGRFFKSHETELNNP